VCKTNYERKFDIPHLKYAAANNVASNYQKVCVITFQLTDEFKTHLRAGFKPFKKLEQYLDLIT
jgi:hypothetical protein